MLPLKLPRRRGRYSFLAMAGRQIGDKAGFEAKISRKAALAQLVEHRIRNAEAACSSHAGGTIISRAQARGKRCQASPATRWSF